MFSITKNFDIFLIFVPITKLRVLLIFASALSLITISTCFFRNSLICKAKIFNQQGFSSNTVSMSIDLKKIQKIREFMHVHFILYIQMSIN